MWYNTVLKAMSNSGDAVAAAQAADVERAQYWFDESQAAMPLIPVSGMSIYKHHDRIRASETPADLTSFNQVIAAHARAGSTQASVSVSVPVQALAQRSRFLVALPVLAPKFVISAHPLSGFSFLPLVEAEAEAGRDEDALRWLERMQEEGVTCDSEVLNIMYSRLVTVCGQEGRLRDAARWFERLGETGIAFDARSYFAMMQCCAKAGNVDGAMELFQRMEDSGLKPDVEIYGCMINACAQAE
ncbi:unnamed protein product, partial [Polarella glacialis]